MLTKGNHDELQSRVRVKGWRKRFVAAALVAVVALAVVTMVPYLLTSRPYASHFVNKVPGIVLTAPGVAQAMCLVDMDGDGNEDILVGHKLCVAGQECPSPQWTWLENDGRGGFLDGAAAVCPGSLAAKGEDGDGWLRHLVVADLDGKGGFDVAVVYDDASLDESIELLCRKTTSPLFDRHEKLETGTGDWESLLEPEEHLIGTPSISSGDLDRDGDIDLVAAYGSGLRVVWFENRDGSGSYEKHLVFGTRDHCLSQTGGLYEKGICISRRYPYIDVLVYDANSDGNPDIVLAGNGITQESPDGFLFVLVQDEQGDFVPDPFPYTLEKGLRHGGSHVAPALMPVYPSGGRESGLLMFAEYADDREYAWQAIIFGKALQGSQSEGADNDDAPGQPRKKVFDTYHRQTYDMPKLVPGAGQAAGDLNGDRETDIILAGMHGVSGFVSGEGTFMMALDEFGFITLLGIAVLEGREEQSDQVLLLARRISESGDSLVFEILRLEDEFWKDHIHVESELLEHTGGKP